MCDSACRNNKQAPNHPEQLTTERVICEQCKKGGANGGDKNTCKCYFCGIGTDNFICGSLLETWVRHLDYHIVLIENVHCPGVENLESFKKLRDDLKQTEDRIDFVPLYDEKLSDYYIRKIKGRPKIYHMFDLRMDIDLYNLQGRGEDETFHRSCIQHDLSVAANILDGTADTLQEYRKIYAAEKGLNTPVYQYTNTSNGKDCPLIDLAFPILIDGQSVAVMIVGQIVPIQTDDGSYSIDDRILKDIAKCVDEFTAHMQERANMRKSDYLYRFLTKLYKNLDDSDHSIDLIPQIIKDVYHDIDQAFDYNELTVFYTDTDQEAGYSFIHFPESDTKAISFQKEDLISAVYAKDDDKQLRKLFGINGDANVGLYRQCSQASDDAESSPECFILTSIKWKRKESKSISNFFDLLNARLFSLLMTKLAIEQKMSQDELIQTFSHDINQKLEIVETHTRLMNEKKEKWDLEYGSRVTEDIRNYFKDIRNLEMQLRHFTKEVQENKHGFPMTIDVQSFFPYGAFLFNLQEYYNSMDIVRRLYMITPSSVAIHKTYPLMRADPVLIERCANNLLNNASKYSYRYTNFYLDCYKTGDNYIIEVINFSSPIKADIKYRMFERGVSSSIIRNYKQKKGKGYGLAIVKQICDLHHGRVEYLPEEYISAYNIPVLRRLITTIREAESEKKLEELTKYRIDISQYQELEKEYERLANQPLEGRNNRVAFSCGIPNVLQEVCNSSAQYIEVLTAHYLRMALRMPTVRIKFRITLPQ